jgi:hypothetical protein
MAVCFIANKNLTVPYSDIGRHLRQNGEQVVWLSPSTRWSRWLEAEGWPKQDILNLPDHAVEWMDHEFHWSIADLADLEADPPATIGNIVLMCRNLRRRPKAFAYAYLASARRHVEPFLRKTGAEVVFGEATWGFEHLTWLVCRKIGIPMVTPLTTRIPRDRFYFSFAKAGDEDRRWAEEFLDEWTARPVQPAYSKAARGYKIFRKRWLSELAIGLFHRDLDRYDETLWPLGERIIDRIRRATNALMFRASQPCEPARSGEPYVMFCVHHQPEAAIDVYGALHSNQRALIETLSRIIPATHKLWIKEHSGGIGDRPLSWYRTIGALPNVRLIDPYLDIYELIRGASLVVTISGTVGYETALMGNSALCLAPIFFAPLMSSPATYHSHPLLWPLREILAEPTRRTPTRQKRIEFLAHLHANSYPGDPPQLEVPAAQRANPEHLGIEKHAFAAFLAALRTRT